MTDTLDKYQRLQTQADKLQRDADRAEGALSQLIEQLEEGYGASDLKEAKAKLTELEQEAEGAEAKYIEAMGAFEKQWGDKLREYS